MKMWQLLRTAVYAEARPSEIPVSTWKKPKQVKSLNKHFPTQSGILQRKLQSTQTLPESTETQELFRQVKPTKCPNKRAGESL